MLLLSLTLFAAQFDIAQLEFDSSVTVRTGYDTLFGIVGTGKFIGIRGDLSATSHLNEYTDLVAAVHTSAGRTTLPEDILSVADADLIGHLSIDQLFGDYQIKVGRLPFEFGNGRIISANTWQFEYNIHDAILVHANYLNTDFDFFVSKAEHGGASILGDEMLGFYGEQKFGENGAVEAYLFRRQQDIININEYNLALRWLDRSLHGLDYDLMLMLQHGSQGQLEITSNAYVVNLSKQLDFGHGIGFEVAVAQGEGSNPQVRQSYNPVMIDQHKFNGRADMVTFSNLIDFSINYWLNWNQRWNFHVDFHDFNRQSSVAGSLNGDRSFARELDFYMDGKISDNLRFDFGLSIYSPQNVAFDDNEQVIIFAQATYDF
ncbi:MAG: alginate export family protein [Planctomycetes bacterium]|nr:alginate export family protein [Planctomycetota bacterium]